MFSQLRRKKQQKELLSDLMKVLNVLLKDQKENDEMLNDFKKHKETNHVWSFESFDYSLRLHAKTNGGNALSLLLEVQFTNGVRHTLSMGWVNGQYQEVLIITNLIYMEDKMFEYSFDKFKKEVRKMDVKNIFEFLFKLSHVASGMRFEEMGRLESKTEVVHLGEQHAESKNAPRLKEQQNNILYRLLGSMNQFSSEQKIRDKVINTLSVQKKMHESWTIKHSTHTARFDVIVETSGATRLITRLDYPNGERNLMTIERTSKNYYPVKIETNELLGQSFECSFETVKNVLRQTYSEHISSFLSRLEKVVDASHAEKVRFEKNRTAHFQKQQKERDALIATRLLDQTYINYCLDEKRFDLLEEYMSKQKKR